MARSIKEEERAVKRNEILETARRLIYTKGYEQMTIQDILEELQISKGAFYHYFSSKQDLLEALIERIYADAEQILRPVLEDAELPALDKLHRYFDTAARWKTTQKAFLLALLRVWYADENAIVRQKVTETMIERIGPLLSRIVHQGIQEGVLTTSFPDQAGAIIITLMQSLGDAFVRVLLSSELLPSDVQRLEGTVQAFNDALERVLGAPRGSLQLVDMEAIDEWIVIPRKELVA
jgi:AcrR family transcriptional regulator